MWEARVQRKEGSAPPGLVSFTVIVRRLEIPQKSTSKALLGVQTLTLVWGCNVWDSCSQRCSAYSQHDLGAPSATVGGAGFVSRSDG